jgi:small subunit ribosomal protein S14
MAKKSVEARQKKREKLVALYAERRKTLKEAGDYAALDKLPRNSSKVRLRNRCQLTGRPRGYVRMFGICRIKFRDLASDGKIPGVTKASW